MQLKKTKVKFLFLSVSGLDLQNFKEQSWK